MAKGKPYEHSLVGKVVEAVKAKGAATVDDLELVFPDFTRSQIHAALANARDRRLLRIRVKGNGSHSPSLWEPGAIIPSPLPEVKPSFPIPSVWALGSAGPWPGQWPPLAEGRLFELLGDWNAEDVIEEERARMREEAQ